MSKQNRAEVQKISGMKMLADGVELNIACKGGDELLLTVGAEHLMMLAEAALMGSYSLNQQAGTIEAVNVQDIQTRQLEGGWIALEAAIGVANSATYIALPLHVAEKLAGELASRIASLKPPGPKH